MPPRDFFACEQQWGYELPTIACDSQVFNPPQLAPLHSYRSQKCYGGIDYSKATSPTAVSGGPQTQHHYSFVEPLNCSWFNNSFMHMQQQHFQHMHPQ